VHPHTGSSQDHGLTDCSVYKAWSIQTLLPEELQNQIAQSTQTQGKVETQQQLLLTSSVTARLPL
jgi:hypothetical protein